MRCSWIQRGSFPRLSARANRFQQEGEGEREDIRPPVQGGAQASFPI